MQCNLSSSNVSVFSKVIVNWEKTCAKFTLNFEYQINTKKLNQIFFFNEKRKRQFLG